MALPNFITIRRGPQEALTSGVLGPDQQPLTDNDPVHGLDFIEPEGDPQRFAREIELLHGFDEAFHSRYQSPAGETHHTSITRAVQLMNSQLEGSLSTCRASRREHPRNVCPAILGHSSRGGQWQDDKDG